MTKGLVGACAIMFALSVTATAADWGCTNVWIAGKLIKTGVCNLSHEKAEDQKARGRPTATSNPSPDPKPDPDDD